MILPDGVWQGTCPTTAMHPPVQRCLGVLTTIATLLVALPARAQGPHSVDCRYEVPHRRDPDAMLEGGFLPSSDIFRPLLADPKEPRFAASIQRVHFQPGPLASQSTGQGIWAGVVSFGSILGIYGWRGRHTCNGVQVGLLGGVFSQFNLDATSAPLINADYIVGIPVTLRHDGLSVRADVHHQSSHLGDEFVLFNPQVHRLDMGYEILEAIVSFQDTWWRVYGGGGYILHSQTYHFGRWKLQAGGELRARSWQFRVGQNGLVEPVLGVDATSFSERDWGVTVSAKGGLSATTSYSTRHIRALVVFMTGFYPFGQFFARDQWTNVGLEAQFEY